MIGLLNITDNKGLNSIKLKIQTEFQRHLPAEAQTVSHGYEIEIYSSSMDPIDSDGAKKISQLRNALENCTDVEIDFNEGYTSALRFTASSEIKEIEDEKYILPKNIQLGFKGCIKGQLFFSNNVKMENTYLKSYFTFRSKAPEEKDYSEAEFHAFNDVISETISGYSVLTFYFTFILVAGTYIADFLASEPEKIMFTDLPHPEQIVSLCEGVKISRYSNDFKNEEELYTILIEFMRSPDFLKRLTQSSIENFDIRKQKNVDDKEEKEEEENKIHDEREEIKKEKNDQDIDYYSDEDNKILENQNNKSENNNETETKNKPKNENKSDITEENKEIKDNDIQNEKDSESKE